VAQVQTTAADDVGHERVACDQIAPDNGDRESVEVCGVARASAAFWELVLNRPSHPTTRFLRGAVRVGRQPASACELAKQVDKLQIGARPRLTLVDGRLEHDHGTLSDRFA
jgi:hypothetical protein